MQHRPKKSLGQNFLTDKNLQAKIIAACGFTKQDIILEIGAGSGALTRLIAKEAGELYSLEIDSRLIGELREEFKSEPSVKIIHADILKTNLGELLGSPGSGVKVFGNIPYYITTPIIERLLEYRGLISQIFLTVQKEFAERMIAKPGSKTYGSLSCFVQYYTLPEMLFIIKRNSFFPSPKVDSCFLRMDVKKELPLGPQQEKLFFKVVRAAFNQRRKTLRNSLKGHFPQEKVEEFLLHSAAGKNARPEQLSLQDFISLIKS